VLAVQPPWLVLPSPDQASLEAMEHVLAQEGLDTVCASASCPNIGECFARRTCTFMILGDVCTRGCRFCGVGRGLPGPPDDEEPARVARAVRCLEMKHVVLTSVTRDDLDDGGASLFRATIEQLHARTEATVEALIPDLAGDRDALDSVLDAVPEVLGHNVETVPRLYETVRPGAFYDRSMEVLAQAAECGCTAKSGLMLGLGETLQEVFGVLRDLRAVGCEIVTLGQYLQPSSRCLPVVDYIAPAVFEALRREALAMGFLDCVAGPLVRSSYKARGLSRRVSK
jgi:lipoyl synthase